MKTKSSHRRPTIPQPTVPAPAPDSMTRLFAHAESFGRISIREFGDPAPAVILKTLKGYHILLPHKFVRLLQGRSLSETLHLLCRAHDASAILMMVPFNTAKFDAALPAGALATDLPPAPSDLQYAVMADDGRNLWFGFIPVIRHPRFKRKTLGRIDCDALPKLPCSKTGLLAGAADVGAARQARATLRAAKATLTSLGA